MISLRFADGSRAKSRAQSRFGWVKQMHPHLHTSIPAAGRLGSRGAHEDGVTTVDLHAAMTSFARLLARRAAREWLQVQNITRDFTGAGSAGFSLSSEVRR
jgi:hypothetical protein